MNIRTNWRDGAHFDEAGAGAGDGGAAATAAAAAAQAAAAVKPWYDGKADAETIGYWQNKAWKADDPVTIALEATKAAREAQKFVGVPPEQIIRLPKDPNDAGWKDVWARLGAPKEAKEYDFSAVKRADGTAIDEAFAETIRKTAFDRHVPKEVATAFAQEIVKLQEGRETSLAAEAATKLATEKADLLKNWGPNAEMNKLLAMQGAKRLGITPEAISALEKVSGYAAVMEAMRKIGAGTSEDTFVEGKTNGTPTTAGAAQARLNELMADQAWGKRLTTGDTDATREFHALTAQIAAAA